MNIKKGQFLSPWEMQNVVDKARSTGNEQIMVCERGFSFGYNNLVSDMRSLSVMRETGCPVVFDATHSVQLPGGKGTASGGQREFVPVLARAAIAAGVAGVFMETHPDPDKALSDGPNAWPLARMEALLDDAQGAGSDRQIQALRGKSVMSKIVDIRGREIIDSRGNPTVEADVVLESGALGRAAVPSGASTGTREAVELRDGDKKRYLGKGVRKAVANVNGEIAQGAARPRCRAIRRARSRDDRARRHGEQGAASARTRCSAVSLATAHAAARETKQSLFRHLGGAGPKTLPVPMMNIINGGAHADNSVDIQEFMILPVGAPSLSRSAALRRRDLPHAQEGAARAQARAPRSATRAASRRTCRRTKRRSRRSSRRSTAPATRPGEQIFLGLDVASTEFFADGIYELESEDRKFTAAQFVDYLAGLVGRYPIVTIEDGMGEDDWDGWALLTQRLGKRVQLVGDDLFVTNTKILQEGIDKQHRERDPDQGRTRSAR